eukprot:691593-Hanusia_phi.AAC.4
MKREGGERGEQWGRRTRGMGGVAGPELKKSIAIDVLFHQTFCVFTETNATNKLFHVMDRHLIDAPATRREEDVKKKKQTAGKHENKEQT